MPSTLTVLVVIWAILLGFVVIGGSGKASWRVIDGQPANRGQFPFIASMGMCTASILSEDTILTAAHCVCKGGPVLITVGVITDWDNVNNRQDAMVQETIIHPGYEKCGRTSPRDIAILKLATKLKYNPDVQPVELFCGEVKEGDKLVNMGFGQDNRFKAGQLKYGYNTANFKCGSDFICSNKTPNHIYFGDSGGPMMVMKDNRMLQAGVNSGIGFFSMYANIPQACDWIKSQI